MEDEEEEYTTIADLRHQLNHNGPSSSLRPHFPQQHHMTHNPQEVFLTSNNNIYTQNYYELMLLGQHHHPQQITAHEILPRVPYHHHEIFHAVAPDLAATTTNSSGGTLEGGTDHGLGGKGSGGDGGTGRWPRQETLTLLEVRSRLDHKFKEANQKGPLWDELSRIMSEEHGYQRSGKKCREKFENLYKYYKKTKEGKAGRQDGKHYRFFRQLEALYGQETTPNTNTTPLVSLSQPHLISQNLPSFHDGEQKEDQFQTTPKPYSDSLSLSNNNNSSEFDTSSTDDDSVEKSKKRRGGGGSRRSWKAKIKEFIDAQMRKLMEKQEAWLEKMMKTIEHKERERLSREEAWRVQEAARVDRDHKFWASERAWIEARDAALMEAMHKLTGKEVIKPPNIHDHNVVLGHELSNFELMINKKRKENSRSSGCYYQSNDDHENSGLYNSNQGGIIGVHGPEMLSLLDQPRNINDGSSSSPSNNNNTATVQDNSFRFFMGDGNDHHQSLWENYGANKPNNQ